MAFLRIGMTVAALLYLTVGYAVSQWAALNGEAASHAQRVDSTPFIALSAVFFLAALVSAIGPNRPLEDE
ncbi:MAG: hypothetical protein ACK4XJ_09530 [Fimbriimonadaceae bacterium]